MGWEESEGEEKDKIEVGGVTEGDGGKIERNRGGGELREVKKGRVKRGKEEGGNEM